MPSPLSSRRPVRSYGCPRPAGHTLVELVITLAVLASLAVLGAPSLAGMVRRHDIHAGREALTASLRHARELAVLRRERVLVCPTRNQRTCDKSSDWSGGWLVGMAGTRPGELAGEPLAVAPPLGARTRLISTQGRRYVQFRPRGDAEGSNVSFVACRDGDTRHAAALVVSNPGRIRIAPATPVQAAACATP